MIIEIVKAENGYIITHEKDMLVAVTDKDLLEAIKFALGEKKKGKEKGQKSSTDKPIGANKRWNKEEDRYLIQNYDKMTCKAAVALSREENACRQHAYKLRIVKKNQQKLLK